MAEQFAFQQRFGQGPASHFDKRFVAACTATVNGAGNQRLARAAFAGDQHGGPRVRHTVDHVEQTLHAVIAAHDVLDPETQIQLGLELPILFQHLALRQRPIDGHLQLLIDQRLGQQVKGSGAQGLDSRLDGAITGQQDHRHPGVSLPAVGQDVKTIPVLQPNVHQHQVIGAAIHAANGLLAPGRQIHVIAQPLEPIAHGLQDVTIVVNQQ